jgi:hypothetical protein
VSSIRNHIFYITSIALFHLRYHGMCV